jgi:hypothetical protein
MSVQDGLALAVVAAAGAYLLRTAWRALAGGRQEGGACGTCSAKADQPGMASKQLVDIQRKAPPR